MGTELVSYEICNSAAILTLNSPQTRNALSMPMVDAIMSALQKAEADHRVRALILTGSETAFSAGMDLKELHRALDEMKFDENGGALWTGAFRGEQLIDRLYKFSKPTIAAVNGVAAAAGAALISACDMAVGEPGARIGYPELRRGIQAGMVLIHLMRLIGERHARFMVLTGELITADRAKAIGLINEVVPHDDLMPTAMKWAAAVAMNAPKAETITKSLLEKFSAQAVSMKMAEYKEAPHLTDECRAGLEAFFEKRPAPWTVREPLSQ
jgi:methylglutaconyl-CoA hydratase